MVIVWYICFCYFVKFLKRKIGKKCEHAVSDFYFLFGDDICGGKKFIVKKKFINFFCFITKLKKEKH